MTGPIEPEQCIAVWKEIVGYGAIEQVVIEEIELEYMDGSSDRFYYGYYNPEAVYTDKYLSDKDYAYLQSGQK